MTGRSIVPSNSSQRCKDFRGRCYFYAYQARLKLLKRIQDKSKLRTLASRLWSRKPQVLVRELTPFLARPKNDPLHELAKQLVMWIALHQVAVHCGTDEFILWQHPIVEDDFVSDLKVGARSRHGAALGGILRRDDARYKQIVALAKQTDPKKRRGVSKMARDIKPKHDKLSQLEKKKPLSTKSIERILRESFPLEFFRPAR
jgi:hypothetical protein